MLLNCPYKAVRFMQANRLKCYYRLADAAIQATLHAVWLYAVVIHAKWLPGFYCIAAAWYIISLVIHFNISSRKFFDVYRLCANISVALLVLPLPGLIVIDVLMAEQFLLLYAVPVLILFYTCSCIAEIVYLSKRPVDYLK